MANTLIQIKRSSVTSLPSSLSSAEPAYSYVANTLFMGTADGAGVVPIGGYSYVNKINAAFDFSNTVSIATTAAFAKANSANYYAYLVDANTTAAFDKANTANYFAYLVNANTVAAFNKANTGYTIATNAYDMANTANVNAANASYLSVGTVPSGRISGPYTGITGVGTILAGTWNADVITVPYGGTGGTSFTQNGILYGNTAGPLKVTSAGTEGQVLQADSSGVPQFAHLDGGSF